MSSDAEGGGRTSSNGCIKATGFLPGKLARHYDDHGMEFEDCAAMDAYERRARQFFEAPITRATRWFEDDRGVLFKSDRLSREFGKCKPDGSIITYFRAGDRNKYWEKQREKYAL